MSTYLGNQLLSGVATNTISNAHSLLDFKWTDHILNEMSWLRADTFSWQSGDVYVAAYNHLVADYNGGTSQTETIGSYTITYVLATDGHKITTDETTVANIYNESGVAWYYILDTTNTRFKLPRSSHGNIVEKYQNGSSWYRVYSDGWCEQGARYATSTNIESISFFKQFANVPTVFASVESTTRTSYIQSSIDIYNLTTSGFTRQYLMNITDGWAWMACGYLSSVPSNGQYKNLYFYVGQFSQTATEQTAGLNSELFNGKMDLDAGNATSSTKEAIVGWGMPDYTAGIAKTVGASYKAEQNGFIKIDIINNSYGSLVIDGVTVVGTLTNNASMCALSFVFPIAKGQVYNASGVYSITFYPAKGG